MSTRPSPEPRLTGELIRAVCEATGSFTIIEGTWHPATVMVRLLDVFRALAPVACNEFIVGGGAGPIPEAALEAEAHPFWDSPEGEAAISGLIQALNRVAPAGFAVAIEGPWSRIGFFR